MSINSEGSMTLGTLSAAWVVLVQSCSVHWGAMTAWAHAAAGNHKWQDTEGELPYHWDPLCLVLVTRKQLLSAQRARKSWLPANWCLVCSSKESGLINGRYKQLYSTHPGSGWQLYFQEFQKCTGILSDVTSRFLSAILISGVSDTAIRARFPSWERKLFSSELQRSIWLSANCKERVNFHRNSGETRVSSARF